MRKLRRCARGMEPRLAVDAVDAGSVDAVRARGEREDVKDVDDEDAVWEQRFQFEERIRCWFEEALEPFAIDRHVERSCLLSFF